MKRFLTFLMTGALIGFVLWGLGGCGGGNSSDSSSESNPIAPTEERTLLAQFVFSDYNLLFGSSSCYAYYDAVNLYSENFEFYIEDSGTEALLIEPFSSFDATLSFEITDIATCTVTNGLTLAFTTTGLTFIHAECNYIVPSVRCTYLNSGGSPICIGDYTTCVVNYIAAINLE